MFLNLHVVFLCSVQHVHCIVQSANLRKLARVNKEDFDIKSGLTYSQQFF